MKRFAATLLLAAVAAADESVVQTALGPVQGIVQDRFRVFEGVPYAAPPVGELRWQPPQPVAAWGPSVLNATVDPPGCVQLCTEDEPPHICPGSHISEDCLYMNIWTPRMPNGPPAQPLPVIIFIHGGNFHDGYAGGLDADGGLLYDGENFVNVTNTIICVINYRLGALGFLYLGPGTTVGGNYGLMDQVAAMEFVRSNIAPFGGDPTKVTLMGQSAGAMSISAHLSRPQTNGLYQGVVMHSNPYAEAYRDPASAMAIASAFANYSGCDEANYNNNATLVEACLRKITDINVLLNAEVQAETYILADLSNLLQIVVAWSPTIGTDYLPVRPLEAFQAGNVIDVPIMVGTTSNETVIFVYEALSAPMSQLEYEAVAIILFGLDNFLESFKLYPYPTPLPEDYRIYASYLLTDGLFLCPTRNATEALLVQQPNRKSPIWHYQYSHVLVDGSQLWNSNFTECWNNVCHGSDLPMWWHPNDPAVGNYTATEDNLSTDMNWYWANFAATGSPGQGNPARPMSWPAYNASTRLTLNFETSDKGGITSIQSLRSDFCAWWDTTVGYHVY